MKLFIPQNYQPLLDVNQTEKAIKLVKDSFQQDLASELRLRRVTAPLFVMKGTGINDDLNGIEREPANGKAGAGEGDNRRFVLFRKCET